MQLLALNSLNSVSPPARSRTSGRQTCASRWRRRAATLLPALLAISLAGCGTTKWSDTSRTATEQLLISDAIDRAVSQIDFSALKGEKVYLETKYLAATVDKDYLISTLRQHILASEVVLSEKPEEADFVVEARSGAVGTSRHDLLYGLPATNLPSIAPVPGVPNQIPEIPFAKRTSQMGVAKIAVFAYDRESGERVWQSGMHRVVSNARDLWVLGAGPFQKGTIYEGQGDVLKVPLAFSRPKSKKTSDAPLRVSRSENFRQQDQLARREKPTQQPPEAVQAAEAKPDGAEETEKTAKATVAAQPEALPPVEAEAQATGPGGQQLPTNPGPQQPQNSPGPQTPETSPDRGQVRQAAREEIVVPRMPTRR